MPITSIEQVTDTGTLHEYLLWVRTNCETGRRVRWTRSGASPKPASVWLNQEQRVG